MRLAGYHSYQYLICGKIKMTRPQRLWCVSTYANSDLHNWHSWGLSVSQLLTPGQWLFLGWFQVLTELGWKGDSAGDTWIDQPWLQQWTPSRVKRKIPSSNHLDIEGAELYLSRWPSTWQYSSCHPFSHCSLQTKTDLKHSCLCNRSKSIPIVIHLIPK